MKYKFYTYINPGLTKCDSVENQILAEVLLEGHAVYKIFNILMKINHLYYAGLSGSRLPEDY